MYAVWQGNGLKAQVVAKFKTYGAAVRFARGLLMAGEQDVFCPSKPLPA